MLPSLEKTSRRLIDSFLGQRAAKELPKSELEPFDWFLDYWIYYLPDEDDDIVPAEWEVKEHETYSHRQAAEVWRQRGCEL